MGWLGAAAEGSIPALVIFSLYLFSSSLFLLGNLREMYGLGVHTCYVTVSMARTNQKPGNWSR